MGDLAEEIAFAKKSSKTTKSVFNDKDVTIIDHNEQIKDENIDDKSKEANARATLENSKHANQQEDKALQEEDDVDALLASTDDDFHDLDLADFDDDDDLEDLENMLKA